ncbi:unnamed protein product, partial [Laminaria digitata]
PLPLFSHFSLSYHCCVRKYKDRVCIHMNTHTILIFTDRVLCYIGMTIVTYLRGQQVCRHVPYCVARARLLVSRASLPSRPRCCVSVVCTMVHTIFFPSTFRRRWRSMFDTEVPPPERVH